MVREPNGIEEDILKDVVPEEDDEKEEFKPQRRITAKDIQRQRREFQEKEERKRNLGNVPSDKLKRHALIKALVDSNQAGEGTPIEVQKALLDNKVNVSLTTVCKDLREINKIDTYSMKKIDNMLVGILKGYLDKLDTIAEDSDSDETRIRAINAAFDDTRKLYDILDTIATRTVMEQTEKAKLQRLGNPINEVIQFVDSPERVNKDIYYKDERDKIIEWLQGEIGTMIEKEGKTYDSFSNPTAYNTFKKTTDDMLEIIKSLKEIPHRLKKVQQEKEHKDNSIKMSK
jgi:hypothetical protein